MLAALAVPIATSVVAKAASLPLAASAAQPLVIAVQSMPMGDPMWLHYLSILGAPFVAAIAAWIAWRIQTRQADTAHKAWKTADTKLKLELFDKRYAIFQATRSIITDVFMTGEETEYTNGYTRLSELVAQATGAGWLLDEKIETFIVNVSDEAHQRFLDFAARVSRQQQTWNEQGWHVTEEMEAGRERMRRQQATLIELFTPYMQIRHDL